MSEDEIGVDVVIENEEGSIDIQSDVLKGDKGDKGDPTATIEINQVLTGEAGTEAKIDNIGTDVNMKLNITIPRGDTSPRRMWGISVSSTTGSASSWSISGSLSPAGTASYTRSGPWQSASAAARSPVPRYHPR